jgi:hypothetical protein
MTAAPEILWFRADQRPELAARYQRGQRACYARHGAAAAADQPLHPGVHMIAALGERDTILAGMRVHQPGPGHPLPVELALQRRCPISAALAARQPAPVVEMCGLWLVDDPPLPGLAAAVTRVALAACRVLGARSVVGCAHQHILPFYRRYGAVVDESLGAHPYPGPRYTTQVVFGDLVTLGGAVPDERAGVLRLTDLLRRAPALRWDQAWPRGHAPRDMSHPPAVTCAAAPPSRAAPAPPPAA